MHSLSIIHSNCLFRNNRLKYLVLSHELSHYILHFPLLLLSEIVERISWTTPEMGESESVRKIAKSIVRTSGTQMNS